MQDPESEWETGQTNDLTFPTAEPDSSEELVA